MTDDEHAPVAPVVGPEPYPRPAADLVLTDRLSRQQLELATPLHEDAIEPATDTHRLREVRGPACQPSIVVSLAPA